MHKVLFIEDDQDTLFLYQKRCEMEPIEMRTATTYDEAKEIMRDFTPEVILLDILLGKENGMEILEKLKSDETTEQTPIIMFTNYEEKEVKRKAVELRADKFLIKLKTTPDELIEEVKKIV